MSKGSQIYVGWYENWKIIGVVIEGKNLCGRLGFLNEDGVATHLRPIIE